MKLGLSAVAALAVLVAALGPALAGAEPPAPSHQRPVLGLTLGDPEPLGATPGLPIERVAEGGSAEAMGVRVGDRLLAANGHPLATAADLAPILEALAALDGKGELRLSLQRDGRRIEVSDTMRATPDARELARRQAELEARLTRIAAAPRDEAAQLRRLLDALGRLEAGLAEARAGFARPYPKGELSLRVEIEMRSDASDPSARELLVHAPSQPPAKPPRAEPATP